HKGGNGLDQKSLAPARSFCWNPDCPEYAQAGHHSLCKFGQTDKGVQRYQCRTCKKTYAATKRTLFQVVVRESARVELIGAEASSSGCPGVRVLFWPTMMTARVITTIHACLGLRSRRV